MNFVFEEIVKFCLVLFEPTMQWAALQALTFCKEDTYNQINVNPVNEVCFCNFYTYFRIFLFVASQVFFVY